MTAGSDSGEEAEADDDGDLDRVVAQGTFDLLHPGHVHYLEDAATYGDELHVIVARRENVTHKDPPVLPDRQRRDVVAALSVVDKAHLGHPEDIFVPIERIDPDAIVLGYDQHHDADAIREALRDRGFGCRVERATRRSPQYESEILSSTAIVDRIIDERCP
ncbi:FAD synthetase [Halalkaliarchaeum desulfuricum]|uniref:FAD synthase n=1 Tax=Halalkaliarchaeum desulfuricum TaxID=2055893 RepID=A0A343THN7_9EURY|nr:adenylyltransferase/cytidyltransferase family protein [Halalkaliarchaeum desulfuricum]AUX08609.1 FAD synthetase [Halalkaliarchaeum desulfuricum]